MLFSSLARPTRRPGEVNDSAVETARMLTEGLTVAAIARQRNLKEGTVLDHIAEALEGGRTVNLAALFTAEDRQVLAEAFAQVGLDRLAPVRELLGPRFSYGQLKVFHESLRHKK